MLPKIERILYTTDLTENSKRALVYAFDFAEKYDAEIVILHVLTEISPTVHTLLDGVGGLDENFFKKQLNKKITYLMERIKDNLSRYCTKELECAEDRVATIEICQGHPEEMILKKADELNCGAIVMGNHAKGIISAAIGSVTRRVLRRTKKPVFIVPLLNMEDINHTEDEKVT